MNRHIYGLTLFLFIVKIHFLLYWAFFAPVNFLSTQEVLNNPVVIVENESRMQRNHEKTRQAVLQNAAIDIENKTVSANIRFNDLDTAILSNQFSVELRVFNKKSQAGIFLKPISVAKANNVVSLKGELPDYVKWSKKSNYYAQINFLTCIVGMERISTIEQSIPVLIISDKNH
jgi:hypothetical protein